jgi:hypothetical protein
MAPGGGVLIVGAALLASAGLSLADWRIAAPAIWKEKRERQVTWIGSGVPREDEAEAVRDAILGRGLSTYGDVTRHVADQLFRDDQRQAGWLTDIGLFHRCYLYHACQLLERLDGALVRIAPTGAVGPRSKRWS